MIWTRHDVGEAAAIERAVVGFAEANCYIVGCERTGLGALVDPGTDDADELQAIVERVETLGLTIRSIVNTHGHPDHFAGNDALREALGAEVLIHELDALKLTDPDRNASRLFGREAYVSPPDRLLSEGETIEVGGVSLLVVHTPGHSVGGIALVGDGFVFTGDTLFAGAVGRTDLPCASEGDAIAWEVLLESIREKLFALPDETVVLPGHGPATTVGRERRENTYVR